MKIKGLSKLTPSQQVLFKTVYQKHMGTMGNDTRKKFENKVKEVKWDKNKNCLKVYYQEGSWWHYSTNGSWY